jgi:hypothetical protein
MRNLVRVSSATILVALVASLLTPPASAAGTKVVVIVMENKTYQKIVGNTADAPYINSLVTAGELFTNYSAITSGSIHDYLAMTSGQTFKTTPASPNVFQAIDGTSLAWTEFGESKSGNCGAGSTGNVPGTTTPLFTRAHDPAFQYKSNESCATHDVALTTTSFNPATLPDFSFMVPNQCDDMHTLPTNGDPCPSFFGPVTGSNAIQMGDNWLQAVVPQLLAQPSVTVILTWDEGGRTVEHVVTLEVGAGVTAGSTDATAYNHYGLLAGLYSKFGLGVAPNNAATATPLPIP